MNNPAPEFTLANVEHARFVQLLLMRAQNFARKQDLSAVAEDIEQPLDTVKAIIRSYHEQG